MARTRSKLEQEVSPWSRMMTSRVGCCDPEFAINDIMGTTWRVRKETGIALSFVTENLKSDSLESVLMEAQ
jgi:hypothetical protein